MSRPPAARARDAEPDRCALLVARDRGGRRRSELPVVVALHARGQDAAAAVAAARADFGSGPDIVAPQAARPCNPLQSNLRSEAAYAGFSWYLGDDAARPEAASFGDVLAQLAALLGELEGDFLLCGEGQGAVLAITLGLYGAPGLRGVRVRDGAMPSIDGWTLPAAAPGEMTFLLSSPIPQLEDELLARGARVAVDQPNAGPIPWLYWLAETVESDA